MDAMAGIGEIGQVNKGKRLRVKALHILNFGKR